MNLDRLHALCDVYGPFEFSDGSSAGEEDLIRWSGDGYVYLVDTVGYDPDAIRALIELANAVPALLALLNKG